MKQAQKKRKDIVDAAIEEFGKRGFRGTTVKRIAATAGVSSRTLYKHFESKGALFDAISALMIERKSTISIAPFDPARGIAEQLTGAAERYIAILTEPETIALTRMVTAEMLIDPERGQGYVSGLSTFQDPITRLIAEAMEAGAIRQADPRFASRQLISLLREFFYTPKLMHQQRQDTDGIMQDCLEMFLAHYKVDC